MKRHSKIQADILVKNSGRILCHNEGVINIFELENIFLKEDGIWYLGDIAEEFDMIEYDEFLEGGEFKIFNLKTQKYQELFIRVKKPKCSQKPFLLNIWRLKDIKPDFENSGLLLKENFFS